MSKIASKSGNAFSTTTIISNGFVFAGGQIGQDRKTGKIVEGSIAGRAVQALKNLDEVLNEAGTSLQNAVKINIFITDYDKNFSEMTEAYIKFMPKPYPVRTCVGVAKLPRGTDVEIECTAALPKQSKL